MENIRSVNPYTGKLIKEFKALSKDQTEKEVAKTRKAFGAWKGIPVSERIKYIRNLGQVILKNKKDYAEAITKEMGKPIKESIAEAEKCAWLCDYYAENAEDFLKDEIVKTEAKKSYVTFEPLGIILGIMPWNFPLWQVYRFAVPAIAAGNAALLKHAPNVPLSALNIEKSFKEAGFPENLFRTLLIQPEEAGRLIEEGKVDAVSLTGSVRAGSIVGGIAGKSLKKVVLELGGSDPFIVLEDADIDRAAEFAVKSRFLNTGQSCIAAKRIIVMEKAADDFEKKFVDKVRSLKVGDPMDESTDIGPVSKKQFAEELEKQLEDARKRGARIVEGNDKPDKGFFIQPTIIRDADLDMKVCHEEVFGPIVPIITVKSEEEAVKIANSTEFGLGASIWSKDLERAERIASRIEAGAVFVNGMVKSDPRLPFGGIKRSGIGRELSHYGIKEFVNIKTVVVNE